MLEKWVTYNGQKYLVKCRLNWKEFAYTRILELYLPENTNYPICMEECDLGLYGSNDVDIVSNFVKDRVDSMTNDQKTVIKFDEWDGVIK